MAKNVPLQNGSGKGRRANQGRGGCVKLRPVGQGQKIKPRKGQALKQQERG